MDEYVDLVGRSLRADSRREFDRRVEEQATRLGDALHAGRLDSPGYALGLELEAYAVDGTGRLVRVPDAVFESDCERELGRHNVELHTDPDPFDGAGIDAQATALRRHYRNVQRAADREGIEIVLDAMWTIPPAEGTNAYLGDVRDRDGTAIAENMTPSPRYYAIDNDVLGRTGGSIPLSVPGAEARFPSLLFESLTSSIQPHVQVPDATAFPRHYNTAIRTLGPVLALATNSPLLPLDLYDFVEVDETAVPVASDDLAETSDAGTTDDLAETSDRVEQTDAVDDPYRLLEETAHELRIPVFEAAINHAWEKVRFPTDVRGAADTLDRLVADATCAPFLREWLVDGDRETFPDLFWELDHKRGTYWRWLRAVTGGQPVDGGDRWSIRIEYRPLPTQPTIDANVGFQCLVAGLVRGLCASDHPLGTLDREAAQRSFYSAVENGIDAELAWITADGTRTTDSDVIYEELFAFARRGLREQGVPSSTAEAYLGPIEARWTERTTPSRWKLARVREHLDAGSTFEEAVHEMQTEYVRRATTGDPVVQWS